MEYLRFELQGMDVIQRTYAQAPAMVNEEILQFLELSTAHLLVESVDRAPSRSGALRDSISRTVAATPAGVLGVVGTALDYAPPVELGSKPHEIRPRLKKALAFGGRVVKKVNHPGFKGSFFFKRAYDANKTWVDAQFALTLGRIVTRLDGAA